MSPGRQIRNGAYLTDNGGTESPSPFLRADVGVLLVHGIGDHKEGETLVSFGEPLFDWLREWLLGKGDVRSRGHVRVTEARLLATRTEPVSPAYAEVELSLTDEARDAEPPERWLVTEAWWGDSVQPPRTLRLLGWLLTRGPLLIYWHFHVGPLRKTEEPQSRMWLALVALLLAGLMQTVVLVAIVLSLIPFGPWRRFVLNAVRTLTLTLGDSFVLLEQDFQCAALVRRVERSLDWLAQRAIKLIVVAHSQGGAIAHEALRRMRTNQVVSYISIGSGLEKLQFLRHVRDKRGGLGAAALLAPMMVLFVTVALGGVFGGLEGRWLVGLGFLFALALIGAFASLAAAFLYLPRKN